VALEAVDDPQGCARSLADLGRVKDDGDDRHPAAAARAGQDVYRVDLGQEP
jgi:hypothetical protein